MQVDYRPLPTDPWHHAELEGERTVADLFTDLIPRDYWAFTDMSRCIGDIPEECREYMGREAVETVERAKREAKEINCYEVMVNDEVIDLSKWEYVVVEEGDRVVISSRPAGFFDSLKKAFIIAAIVFVAVYIGVSFVGPGAVGLTAGTTTIAGFTVSTTTAFALAAAAVTFVSTVLMSFLTPKLGGVSGGQSATYKVEGIGNRMRHWEPVPKIFGRFKFHPIICGHTYDEAVGEKTYLRFLMTFGQGRINIGPVKLGETYISRYQGIETNPIKNASHPLTLKYYQNRRRIERFQRRLTTSWAHFTTAEGASEAIVNLQFPQGIFFADGYKTKHSEVTVEWRWKVSTQETYGTGSGGSGALLGGVFSGLKGLLRLIRHAVGVNTRPPALLEQVVGNIRAASYLDGWVALGFDDRVSGPGFPNIESISIVRRISREPFTVVIFYDAKIAEADRANKSVYIRIENFTPPGVVDLAIPLTDFTWTVYNAKSRTEKRKAYSTNPATAGATITAIVANSGMAFDNLFVPPAG